MKRHCTAKHTAPIVIVAFFRPCFSIQGLSPNSTATLKIFRTKVIPTKASLVIFQDIVNKAIRVKRAENTYLCVTIHSKCYDVDTKSPPKTEDE
jgi:hypothetical protein